MRPGDLAGKRELVVRDVGLRVPGAVLELNFKAATELLQIDLGPVYPERGADLAGFLCINLTLIGHDLPPSKGHAGTTCSKGRNGSRHITRILRSAYDPRRRLPLCAYDATTDPRWRPETPAWRAMFGPVPPPTWSACAVRASRLPDYRSAVRGRAVLAVTQGIVR